MRRQVFRLFPWGDGTRVAPVCWIQRVRCNPVTIRTSISYKGVRETAPYTTACRTICPEGGKKARRCSTGLFWEALFCFGLGQGAHAVEAHGECGEVVEHGGGGRWQDARHAKADERAVETDDETVVVLDAVQ